MKSSSRAQLRHAFTVGICAAALATAFAAPGVAAAQDDATVSDACPGVRRTVKDNIAYTYEDLAKDPKQIWTKHYFSYGLSYSLLTALGSVNISYGVPWREPSITTNSICGKCAASSRLSANGV